MDTRNVLKHSTAGGGGGSAPQLARSGQCALLYPHLTLHQKEDTYGGSVYMIEDIQTRTDLRPAR